MNRETAELWSDAIGAAGTVIRYGHWGRAVLVFPSEQGKARDFENNGMVAAVADLIDAGRVKLYCVDSYDAASWSDLSVPVEERARRHERYESWILEHVLPWIYSDCGGALEVATVGCSLGGFYAANFALRRADLFPQALCFSGNFNPASWHAWGEQGTAAYFNNPMDYVGHLHGDHLDWLRGRVSLLLVWQIGYPLFMKPYDGGAWRGVSRISNAAELHAAYDASGEMLMHLQQAIEGYEVFARSLSIGAETMVMKFQPDQPMHARYAVDHAFLPAEQGAEVVTISRLVNAFFRWEFNSCETLVRAGTVYPIDYANACPDVLLTSLHYYFPWAIKALVKWCVFALVTGRRPRLDLSTEQYFEIADDASLSYADKLAAYRALADRYFDTERYEEFCAASLGHLDGVVLDWVASPDFDRLLVETVRSAYPAREHEQFIAHLRGLLGLWVRDETSRVAAA